MYFAPKKEQLLHFMNKIPPNKSQNYYKRIFLIHVLSILFLKITLASKNDTINKTRLNTITAIHSVSYTGSSIALYNAWYKNYKQSKFHFFNDNAEWLQMDKAGHAFAAYKITELNYRSLTYTGLNKKKSLYWASGLSLLYMSSIEFFDGLSAQWGASSGDIIANTSGIALYGIQQHFWNEQRILIKYSFHKSPYSQYRPEILGSNIQTQLLKDYNAQTYWLSANVKSFLNINRFPKWLNIAVGYGADGMIGGLKNEVPYKNIHRNREYYLSLDVDFSKIKTKNKTLKIIFNCLNIIKVPFPALMLKNKEIKGILY